jgi:hypothetical protein
MTQGAPTSKRTTKQPDTELDLDAWLAKRGLAGEKTMKVGGKTFRFVKTAPAEQITAFATARDKGDLFGAMAALLVDPGEKTELEQAFAIQKQPLEAKAEQEFLIAILNFLVAGDAGESSAS